MTIEVSRTSFWIYRICPTDPLLIERRENKRGARWTWYARRDTVNETRAALLRLGKGEEGGEEGKLNE